MKCEFCKNDHDGTYASGRFCSEKCSRLYSIKKNQEKDKYIGVICKKCNNEFQIKRGTSQEKYICDKCKILFHRSKELTEKIQIKIICCGCGKKYDKIISSSIIKTFSKTYRCDECKIKLIQSTDWNLLGFGSKYKLLLFEQNYKCNICGISEWNSKKIRLHIDHIDGSRLNTEKKNLRLICPNCHSQTDTYCKNKSKHQLTNSKIAKSIIENDYDIRKTIFSLGLSNGGQNDVRFRRIYHMLLKNKEEEKQQNV